MKFFGKLSIIFIIIIEITGCATNKVLDTSKPHSVTYYDAHLEHYIDGVVTEDNVAVLCFSDNEYEIIDETYTITIPMQEYFKNTNEQIERYKKYYTPTYNSALIDKNNMSYGCESLPDGEKITFYEGIRPSSNNKHTWKDFTLNHKNSFFLLRYPPYYSANNPSFSLYLARDGDIPKTIKITSRPKTKTTSCFLCYAGLPFALVLDVVTAPITIPIAIWVLFHAAPG